MLKVGVKLGGRVNYFNFESPSLNFFIKLALNNIPFFFFINSCFFVDFRRINLISSTPLISFHVENRGNPSLQILFRTQEAAI